MRLKPEADANALVKQLREYVQRLQDGSGQPDSIRWYAGMLDTLETTLHHYLEDGELADGLFTDRYWHILRGSVPDSLYGKGVFGQELQYQAWRLGRACEELEAMREWAQEGEGIVVVPDTNILIHCGELRSINWRAAAGRDTVRVIVPLVVVDELDELKRTARDKADRETIRANMRQLKERIFGLKAGTAAQLGDGVTISILPDPRGHRRLPTNDEEICDRAAALKQFGAGVVLASNDYGMHVRAKGFSLVTVEVPEVAN